MKYTQKREKNTLTVSFKANAEEWANFVMRAYEQNKGKYNVPGFRKGHVPKSVLESRYGKGLFLEDALYICAQEYYNEFLDKNKDVMPVARPSIDASNTVASHTFVRMSKKPQRLTFSSINAILYSVRSRASTVPLPRRQSAAWSAFPPGALQTSRTKSPFFGAAARQTSAEAASCTVIRPSANARIASGES